MSCLKETSKVLFILWIVALCSITDAQQYYQVPDTPVVVDLDETDADYHLESRERRSTSEVFIPAPSKRHTPATGIAVEFQEEFQQAMHDRLARLPSNVAHGGSSEATRSVYGGSSEATRPAYGSSTTPAPSMTKERVAFSTESDFGYHSTQTSNIHDEYAPTHDSIRIGSARGVPGVNFPDYTDIPLTSFTCSDKKYLPGFYADMDAGCQVFHVCWPDRQETFLCPMGTTFNQALLACDNWYSSNCSLALHYYDVNAEVNPLQSFKNEKSDSVSSMVHHLLEKSKVESTTSIPEDYKTDFSTSASISSFISQYLPVKAKVVIHPETTGQRSKIVATASVGDRRKVKQSKEYVSVSHVSKDSLSEKALKLSLDESEMQKVAHLKSKIFAFRLNEALDNVLNCVKNDGSVARFYALVDSVVKLVKVIFSFQPEPYEHKPTGKMQEYDSAVKTSFDKLPVLVKDILINTATFISEIKPNPPRKVVETVNAKRVPLTSLNRRFIVKPIITRPTKQVASKIKPGVRTRRVLVAKPLNFSRSDQTRVSSGTKKALLKNYASLIQARHA